MRNSDLFLDAFASVERYLRLRVAADTHMPFSRMLRQVASDDSLLACFSDDLREFADLRTAIVHERGGGRAIAEPHDEVVLVLERSAQAGA